MKRGIKAEGRSKAVQEAELLEASYAGFGPSSVKRWHPSKQSFQQNLNAIGLTAGTKVGGARSSNGRNRCLSVLSTGCDDSDEIRAVQGQRRHAGSRQPKRLTAKETRVVEQLIERHGDDVEAMSRDMELNPMQHTVAKLRKLLAGYAAYPELARGEETKRDFAAPKTAKAKPH